MIDSSSRVVCGKDYRDVSAHTTLNPVSASMQILYSFADLKEAHRLSAELAAKNPRYLPIFERMERELAAASADSPTTRAARVAARSRRTRALI
jgi:hypothetical protein